MKEDYIIEGSVMESTILELLKAGKKAERCELYLHLRPLLTSQSLVLSPCLRTNHLAGHSTGNSHQKLALLFHVTFFTYVHPQSPRSQHDRLAYHPFLSADQTKLKPGHRIH